MGTKKMLSFLLKGWETLLSSIDEITNVTFIYLIFTESYYVAKASLKLGGMFLTQPPECWDCRYEPPHILKIYIFLLKGMETLMRFQTTQL